MDEASGSSTMSFTLKPARLTHFTMFCAEVTAPVMMCASASRRTPTMPTGFLMPPCWSTMNSCGMTCRTSRSMGITMALAASMTRSTSSFVISRSLPGDRHDAAGVDSLDMPAGHAGVDAVHLAPRHELRRFHGVLDGLHGGLDVDHHAAAQPARGGGADADDLELTGSLNSPMMAQTLVVPMSSPTISSSDDATVLSPLHRLGRRGRTAHAARYSAHSTATAAVARVPPYPFRRAAAAHRA